MYGVWGDQKYPLYKDKLWSTVKSVYPVSLRPEDDGYPGLDPFPSPSCPMRRPDPGRLDSGIPSLKMVPEIHTGYSNRRVSIPGQ